MQRVSFYPSEQECIDNLFTAFFIHNHHGIKNQRGVLFFIELAPHLLLDAAIDAARRRAVIQLQY